MHLMRSMKSYLLIRHSPPLIPLLAICLAQKILNPPPLHTTTTLRLNSLMMKRKWLPKEGEGRSVEAMGKAKGGGMRIQEDAQKETKNVLTAVLMAE